MKTAEIISDASTYVIPLRDRTSACPVRCCHWETRGDPGAFDVRVEGRATLLSVSVAPPTSCRGDTEPSCELRWRLRCPVVWGMLLGVRAPPSRAPAGFGGPRPVRCRARLRTRRCSALSLSLGRQGELTTHAQDRPFPPTLLTTIHKAEGKGKSDLRPCLCLPRICLKYESHKALYV